MTPRVISRGFPRLLVDKFLTYNMKMKRISREERLAKSRERAKQTIQELVAASGGSLTGKLRLYKAFYKAHLNYFESTGLELTGYPIVHMTNGPGIDNAQELIDEMVASGLLIEQIGTPGRAAERVYIVDTHIGQLDPEKLTAITEAAKWASELDERQLKEESHQFSWHDSSNGDRMNIFSDTIQADRVIEIRNETQHRLNELSDTSRVA